MPPSGLVIFHLHLCHIVVLFSTLKTQVNNLTKVKRKEVNIIKALAKVNSTIYSGDIQRFFKRKTLKEKKPDAD